MAMRLRPQKICPIRWRPWPVTAISLPRSNIPENNDAWFQASFLESFFRLSLGPNPRIGPGLLDGIFQRLKDVSSVIDAVLQGVVDQQTGIAFSEHIDSDKIGVLGYSLGGETSLATVTGIATDFRFRFPACRTRSVRSSSMKMVFSPPEPRLISPASTTMARLGTRRVNCC